MLNQQSFRNTMCFNSAGLAVGTTTTLTSANAVDYAINGVAYTKAAASNEATPTTDAVTGSAFSAIPVGSGGCFTIGRDSAGALKVAQGQTLVLDSDEKFPSPPAIANLPDTACIIGTLHVKVGTSGAAWTFGTSNLAGPPTDVVFTLVNRSTMPSAPTAP